MWKTEFFGGEVSQSVVWSPFTMRHSRRSNPWSEIYGLFKTAPIQEDWAGGGLTHVPELTSNWCSCLRIAHISAKRSWLIIINMPWWLWPAALTGCCCPLLRHRLCSRFNTSLDIWWQLSKHEIHQHWYRSNARHGLPWLHPRTLPLIPLLNRSNLGKPAPSSSRV